MMGSDPAPYSGSATDIYQCASCFEEFITEPEKCPTCEEYICDIDWDDHVEGHDPDDEL